MAKDILDLSLERVKGIEDRLESGGNDDALLGIHEATTRLWVSVKRKKEKDEVERRLANVMIGCVSAACRLGLDDLGGLVWRRLNELEHELTEWRPRA